MFRFIIAFTIGALAWAQAYAYADLDCSNTDPFILAAKSGKLEKIQQMLSTNINLNVRDCKGATALHAAVQMGQMPVLEELLRQDGLEIDAVDNYFQTPLYFAALHGDIAMSMFLVEAGAQPNARVLTAARVRLDFFSSPQQAHIITWGANKKPETREVEVTWSDSRSGLQWPSEEAKMKSYLVRAKAVVEYFNALEALDFKTTPANLKQAREQVEVFLMLERAGNAKQACGY